MKTNLVPKFDFLEFLNQTITSTNATLTTLKPSSEVNPSGKLFKCHIPPELTEFNFIASMRNPSVAVELSLSLN